MDRFYLSMRTMLLCLFVSSFNGINAVGAHASDTNAVNSVKLYSPFTKISVPPGESVDFNIDVINNMEDVETFDISLSGVPKGWNYSLKSGKWNVGQVSVLPGEKKTLTLNVGVPMKVNKGSYRLSVVPSGFDPLPLTIIVSEQGTYETEFTTQQPNMEGHSDAAFAFNANLRNGTAERQLYALSSDVLRGWTVTFKSAGKSVTSVSVEPNSTGSVTIEVKPPSQIEAGTYKIPVRAATMGTSATLDLEVVITGTYGMELTTPRGLLSTRITAGGDRRVELVVRNTGTSVLNDIKMSASSPANWDVVFDPKTVDNLKVGETVTVWATIKASDKAIAGDYVVRIDARTPEVSSKAEFRVSVKTPMILGWVGILVILLAAGSVYYLFRKYGRR